MFNKDTSLKNISLGVWIIVAFLGFFILYIGSAIFLPIIVSVFLLILFSGIYDFIHQFIKNKYLAALCTLLLFLGFFAVVGYIIGTQVNSFTQNTGKFQEGFTNIITFAENFLMSNFGLDLNSYLNFDAVKNYLSRFDYGAMSTRFFGTVTNLVSYIGTTFILLMFIFLERGAFKRKFRYIFNVKEFKKMENIGKRVYEDLNTYFVSKFFIALFNGIVATIIMSLFGLDFALTFGLIVFIFDFVPVVGGVIAMGLPFLYSLVTFGNVPMSFFMLICLNIPQTISGNFVEPKIMGDRLNLSSFFLIIALIFWSMFWGLLGAFLATPIMATLNIVLSKFETTKPLAILLSKNGRV